MKYKSFLVFLVGILFLGFNTTNVIAVGQTILHKNYKDTNMEVVQGSLHYQILNYHILQDTFPPDNENDAFLLTRYLVCTMKVTNRDTDKSDPAEEISAYDFEVWSGPNSLDPQRKPVRYKNDANEITIDTSDKSEKEHRDAFKLESGQSQVFTLFFIVYPDDNLKVTIFGSSGTTTVVSLHKAKSSNGVITDEG